MGDLILGCYMYWIISWFCRCGWNHDNEFIIKFSHGVPSYVMTCIMLTSVLFDAILLLSIMLNKCASGLVYPISMCNKVPIFQLLHKPAVSIPKSHLYHVIKHIKANK